MLSDEEYNAIAKAFGSVTDNQRVLGRGIEQIGDALATLTMCLVSHGVITKATYDRVREAVDGKRHEMNGSGIAEIMRATKPSEN